LLLAGCDSGGGDPPSDAVASVLGAGSRLREVNGPAEWFDENNKTSVKCSQPADFTVNVTGVAVTAVDRFDEVADGALGNLYVQDMITVEAGEYEGMTVFDPGFTPPDLRVAAGDVLDLFGVLEEFLGPSDGFGKCRSLPEIGGTAQFRLEGVNVAPRALELQDLMGYEKARRYLGMLVVIEDVKIASDPVPSNSTLPTGGRYVSDIDRTGLDLTGVDPADYVKISNELYDVLNEGPPIAKGSTFKSVTGVVTYFYGFKIAPRSADDFVP